MIDLHIDAEGYDLDDQPPSPVRRICLCNESRRRRSGRSEEARIIDTGDEMTDNTRRSDIESGNEGAADAEMTAAAPEDIEYLFAQSATGLGIGRDGHITLHEAAASTLWFSDRPYRLAGHIETQDFVAEWGRGDDNFAEDPPNAVLSTIDGDKVNDVVVVLSDPSLDGKDLSYAVSVIEGSLEPAPGPVSLFIDVIGRPLTPVSLAGARRRGMRRERRRMT